MVSSVSVLKYLLKRQNKVDFSVVGMPGFSLGAAEHSSLDVYNGVPYVVYADRALGYRATVMQYNRETKQWVFVGEPGFSRGSVNCTCLSVAAGIPYVAFTDYTYESRITVMKYNGTEWVVVGKPGFSGPEVNFVSLYVYNGIPYVAFVEGYLYKGKVVKYDVSKGWVSVGKSFNNRYTGFVSLYVYEGTPYVSYTAGDDIPWYQLGRLQVAKYAALDDTLTSSWKPVGNSDFFGPAFYTSLQVEQGVPFVAYGDGNQLNRVSVAKCVGDSKSKEDRWVHVGCPGISRGNAVYTTLYMDAGVPYVAFRDGANDCKASVMKYAEGWWVSVGEPGFSPGEVNYLSLCVQNGVAFVAFADGEHQEKVTVMAALGSE